jgi:ligand-binding sensor domain-containing protein
VARHGAGPGLPNGSILSLANGADNTVFIGTQQGLYAADGDGRHVRQVAIPDRALDAPVWALAERNGVLWSGGLDGIWAVSGARPRCCSGMKTAHWATGA